MVDTHVTIVRPKPGMFFPDFFGYMLVIIEAELIASGEGASGQTELPRTKLKDGFRVSYPASIEEQKRIVAILDEAFEGIAAATANTEKNLANARELFGSILVGAFSELEATATARKLKEVSIDFGRGKSKHRPRNDPMLYGGDYPFIQTGDVRNSSHVITAYSQTYNEHGMAQSKLWPRGTVCITIAANIAETGILDFDACFPDSVIGVVVDETLTTSDYVEYLIQYVKAELQAEGKGSAQANINLATFENRTFPFPDLATQNTLVNKLNALLSALDDLVPVCERKLVQLAELKQSLLQKAFTGQLTAADADQTRHSAAVLAD
ncbi:MAG: restriction endonuclease subunit S [Zoogloeaceae bacterium]|nr:restriction endonuclease subunit S [Zoogloeaceae bacterium]